MQSLYRRGRLEEAMGAMGGRDANLRWWIWLVNITIVSCFRGIDYENIHERLVTARCSDLAMTQTVQTDKMIRASIKFELFQLLWSCTEWRCKCDFNFGKGVVGQSVLFSWPNVEVYHFPGNERRTFNSVPPAWWGHRRGFSRIEGAYATRILQLFPFGALSTAQRKGFYGSWQPYGLSFWTSSH